MKQLRPPYPIGKVPKAVRKARLDNIALVPASLLTHKGKYQKIANNLPKNGVLICEASSKQRIHVILKRVATFLRENGHVVKTLPYSILL